LAIGTYDELQAAIADWLNRDDLTVRIPDFIALAESVIRRRLRRDTTVAALTLDAAVVALPANCELRSVRLNDGVYQHALTVMTPENISDYREYYGADTGVPRYAAVLNSSLHLVPAPGDTSYAAEIIYYECVPAIATALTNWLLTDAPDVYLFGSLAMAEPFLRNDERLPLWQSQFDSAISELEVALERAEYGASLRPVRLPVVFG
jgi:hypothetical protein